MTEYLIRKIDGMLAQDIEHLGTKRKFWLSLDEFREFEVEQILEQVPVDRMSPATPNFALKLWMINRSRLLQESG